MILKFDKKTLEGHWFMDGEDSTGWTEKVPPYTNYVFDEESGEWVRAEPVPNDA